MTAYPDDELGARLDANLTFGAALASVPTGSGFYSALGVGDSLTRERIFEEIGRRYGYDYDDIYDSWIHEKPLPNLDAGSPEPERNDEEPHEGGVAVGTGYCFCIAKPVDLVGIDLHDTGSIVTVDGEELHLMRGATYAASRKIDAVLDSRDEMSIFDHLRGEEAELSFPDAPWEAVTDLEEDHAR